MPLPNIVVAGLPAGATIPQIWNFYPSMDAAERDRTNRFELLCHTYPGGTDIMTLDEFLAKERTAVLSGSITEISEHQFMEMIEVLPPLQWEPGSHFERFLMSEFFTGSFTNQYARLGRRCFHKVVDARDRKTWLDRETLGAWIDQHPAASHTTATARH